MSNRIIRTKHNKYKYYAVRCPLHLASMSDKAGYVVEARLLMALYVGRPLCRNELVLHKDRNPMNNEISNLRVIRKKCQKK